MLPGKALAVGLVAWREAGCRNECTVPVNLSALRMPRRTAQRALQALEAAGLVAVEHRDGRPPLVTLNSAPKVGGADPRAVNGAVNDLPEGSE
jgi:hypothetical protein